MKAPQIGSARTIAEPTPVQNYARLAGVLSDKLKFWQQIEAWACLHAPTFAEAS